ncbi:M1 family metallopeptidase [Lysobacter silvisoli]|uniref:Aminopeptidase N n=1 Tax=Lysobacter silvisoli TaxID=2293254 RepID=A0A371K0B8_9GAMM|nr:M1 family metallopeptidase [Lysobacter silvisoli]RDZ27355.1 M1 family peptidase [Lysobacter silvisoli]
MRYSILTVCLAAALAAACSRDAAPPAQGTATPAANTETAVTPAAVVDAHSYAEPGKVRIDDLALQLAVDFEHKQLGGSATYTLNWVDKSATQLVLDTRDLTIDKVVGERSDGKWNDLKFALAPADKLLGSKLTIEAPDRNARIRVSYKTSPEASGLQWLTPAMTEGKKTPFMFSQSQQIHARSWVPLQDTPSVRFTYTAHVTSPKDAMVLMSADNDPKAPRDGDYEFKMPQRIPSYLLAIAAGDLVFQPISARSGVWAEPAMAPKAAAEFADTEKMMETTEKLYGPYRWERYDILVLPPSFPYGGMENPRLTFATPTVVVGDKSLVSLIAHELAHSWSGNLVTFSTANDAWLNEGFTSYVENRIVESLYGKERADMESVIGRNELKAEFTDDNKALQSLAVKPGDLKDPDDNLTGTVYTKGAWFLEFLEQRFGRENFDAFLRGYFDHFAFQSISTQQFVDYAKANLLDKYPGKVTQAEFDAWLYEPGIPANAPATPSARFDAVDAARKAWLDAGTLPDKAASDKWTTQERVHFIEGMPDTLSVDQLKALDAAYKFTGTPNGEIAQRWYPLAVRSGYTQANEALGAFLQRVGRRKLVMPTYNELVKTPAGLALAEQIFAKAKPSYHPITTGSVEAVIAKAKAAPQPAQ